jgi:hypothetical protein
MRDTPEFEIIAYEPSPIGMICLRRRESSADPGGYVTEITLDHRFLMSSAVTDSERALAFHALAMHDGRELEVLVGGLGLGYTAREALRSERVARVDVVEYLRPVIDWLARGLVPLAAELQADARLPRPGDVYQRLAISARRYDVILIDVDNSLSNRRRERPFTPKRGPARHHRRPACSACGHADSAASSALRRVFREVRVSRCTLERRCRRNRDELAVLRAGVRSRTRVRGRPLPRAGGMLAAACGGEIVKIRYALLLVSFAWMLPSGCSVEHVASRPPAVPMPAPTRRGTPRRRASRKRRMPPSRRRCRSPTRRISRTRSAGSWRATRTSW